MTLSGLEGRQKAKRKVAFSEQSEGSQKKPKTCTERSRARRERLRATAAGVTVCILADDLND